MANVLEGLAKMAGQGVGNFSNLVKNTQENLINTFKTNEQKQIGMLSQLVSSAQQGYAQTQPQRTQQLPPIAVEEAEKVARKGYAVQAEQVASQPGGLEQLNVLINQSRNPEQAYGNALQAPTMSTPGSSTQSQQPQAQQQGQQPLTGPHEVGAPNLWSTPGIDKYGNVHSGGLLTNLLLIMSGQAGAMGDPSQMLGNLISAQSAQQRMAGEEPLQKGQREQLVMETNKVLALKQLENEVEQGKPLTGDTLKQFTYASEGLKMYSQVKALYKGKKFNKEFFNKVDEIVKLGILQQNPNAKPKDIAKEQSKYENWFRNDPDKAMQTLEPIKGYFEAYTTLADKSGANRKVVSQKYKSGDTKVINGITYTRDDKGNWTGG